MLGWLCRLPLFIAYACQSPCPARISRWRVFQRRYNWLGCCGASLHQVTFPDGGVSECPYAEIIKYHEPRGIFQDSHTSRPVFQPYLKCLHGIYLQHVATTSILYKLLPSISFRGSSFTVSYLRSGPHGIHEWRVQFPDPPTKQPYYGPIPKLPTPIKRTARPTHQRVHH